MGEAPVAGALELLVDDVISSAISTRVVAMMVRLPPSSICGHRSVGRVRAAGSMPPESVRPEGGTVRLWREKRDAVQQDDDVLSL